MIPDELIRLLENRNPTRYYTARVLAVQTSSGTVSLSWNAGTATNIPYLTSYTPAINDKVHVLSAQDVGLLVLGKTLATAAPSAGTLRTAYVNPTSSMSWQGNPKTKASTGKAIPGVVRQGSTVTYLYSGAYRYPSGTVTLASTEIITKSELLVSRLAAVNALPVTPVLNELKTVDSSGRPLVPSPEKSFSPTDVAAGSTVWVPIPVDWTRRVLTGQTIGITFAPTSAQLAMVYAEFAAFDSIVETDTSSMAGRLRLTIQNS